MTMEICICVLPNLFQQFLIVNSADKLNSLITLKMQFFFQFIQEFIIYICDDGEVFLTLTLHKLPNHNFKRVLRNKTADHKIIPFLRQPFFFIPAHQLFIIIRQLTECQIRTISDKCCFRISSLNAFTVITLMNILFNIHRITNRQITVLDHHLFRNFPVLSNRCRPLSSHPLMSIWVQIHLSSQFMNLSVKVTCKWSNATGHNINNRVIDMIFFDVFTTSMQSCYIIINRLCRSDLRNVDLKAVCIVEFELMIVNFSHTLKFVFIHAAITIGFACNMIFNIFFVLMVLCELEYKGFVTAVGSKGFCTY